MMPHSDAWHVPCKIDLIDLAASERLNACGK